VLNKKNGNAWQYALALLGAVAAAPPAPASVFPDKPVRMVIPLAPGGGSDIVGRIVAQGLSDHWGKPVVVDNRPGTGSIVGTAIVAKTPGDGYTLLVSSSSFAISPALYGNSGFDARRDFAGITLLASQPSLLVVHHGVAAKTLKELLALAQAKPGALSYGSAGTGSATHLGTALFLHSAKLNMQHIPYKSAGLATTAVLSGEVQVLLTNAASVLPHVGGGKLRAIGVTARERTAQAPEVPTLHESGMPGFEYATWYGAWVPAATPKPLQATLHKAFQAALALPAVDGRLTKTGLQTYRMPQAEFAKYVEAEMQRWQTVIAAAGIKAE
jgi:tripartite-type tricarboxylate transporter receptor subunit TctC